MPLSPWPSEGTEKSFGKKAAPRKGSAGRTDWEEENPHAVALTPGQWENVHNMAESFKNTPCTIAKDLLTEGTPELSVWFDDPITGLRCKIRPDFLRDDDVIIDLKSTKDGSPKGFFWEIKRWGYNYQAAFYTRGINLAYAAAGVDRKAKAFIVIAIENFPPYEVAVYMITEEIIAEAQILINANLEGYDILERELTEEMKRKGWIYLANYGVEGDHVRVEVDQLDVEILKDDTSGYGWKL